MPSFPGVDFLDFDSLLSDEEKLARKTVRQFVDEQVLPIIVQHDREGNFPDATRPANGEARAFRRQPEGLRLRGDVQRGIWPGDPGARTRRFRVCGASFRCSPRW